MIEYAKKISENISEAINTTAFHAFEVASCMSVNMHRYTQSQFFELCLWFIFKLADSYEKNRYDDRNAGACKKAWRIVQLIKNEGEEFDNSPEMWSIVNEYKRNEEHYKLN